MTFNIKTESICGFSYKYLEPELSDLVLYSASLARANWMEKKKTGKVMDPYTAEEAKDPLYEVSPSFLAKMCPRWSPAAWAHAFKAEWKKENVDVVRRIGNEVFYRATEVGSNYVYHTMSHVQSRMKSWIG